MVQTKSPEPATALRPAVVVIGASGGLGASTLVLALARALNQLRGPALAIDLDFSGGGLDVSAGIEDRPGLRWGDLARSPAPPDQERLMRHLPRGDGGAVLSVGPPDLHTPVASAVVAETLSALTGWPLVLDLPAPALLTDLGAATMRLATMVLVLTGLRVRQLADLDAVLLRCLELAEGGVGGAPDLRVVTAGSGVTDPVLDALVVHSGCAHAGHLAPDPAIARALERGAWPGEGTRSLSRLAQRLAEVAAGPAVRVAS